ncbi:MAG: hypothetical protein ABI898_11065 [Sphingomonadales bacterium]
MNMSLLKFALPLALGVLAGNAHAASINCNGQTAPDLWMICNDPQISYRDDQAAALFNQAMQNTDTTGQAALRAQRLGFQRQRGACNANRRCMIAAYDDQIAALQGMLNRPRPAMKMNRPNY